MRRRHTLRSRRVHPRSRGENGAEGLRDLFCGDSSPLTRGKPWGAMFDYKAGRLIPAHAGKTFSGRGPSGASAAHPRSRGENNVGVAGPCQATGSSPLTRGKHALSWWPQCSHGLIPAHAGKTRVVSVVVPGLGAHPRSRGENSPPHSRLGRSPGSSPLTRGKVWGCSSCRRLLGLIPAHAGKTPPPPRPSPRRRAHPRSRRENLRRLLV